MLFRSLRLQEGVEAARKLFAHCKFDSRNTLDLLDGLAFYHRSYDEKGRCFSDTPEKDWSSHRADAFRYMAVADRDETKVEQVQLHAQSSFDPLYTDQPQRTAVQDFEVFA